MGELVFGYKGLRELLDSVPMCPVISMPKCTDHALAKCCFEDMEMEQMSPDDFGLGDAIAVMVSWIRKRFMGGESWSEESAVAVYTDRPGHYLHKMLDVSAKGGEPQFSRAARRFMDYVHRGEPKGAYSFGPPKPEEIPLPFERSRDE